jgi:hypothetical protein
MYVIYHQRDKIVYLFCQQQLFCLVSGLLSVADGKFAFSSANCVLSMRRVNMNII